MHKDFYASGFLYHPPSGQILLQKQKITSQADSSWLFFGNECADKNCGKSVFRRVLEGLLGLKLNPKAIYPVYSYSSRGKYKKHHILFAEVQKKQNFSSKDRLTFSWFTFKQALKLPLAEQTKHDIIIGQRVIDALSRRRFGQ